MSIQTGSYTDKEGRKVYTTDVVLDTQEFAESKQSMAVEESMPSDVGDGFMDIPEGYDAGIPFD